MKTLIVLLTLLTGCSPVNPYMFTQGDKPDSCYTYTLTVIACKESTINFYYNNVFDCSRELNAGSETEFYFSSIVTVKYENDSLVLDSDTTIYLGK